MTPQQQIVAKCAAVAKIAADFYGVDLSKVGVRFDLKGGCCRICLQAWW
jgi:hypothetical protein